ncbi:MAG: hypothetical protein NYU90_05475 [Aigarchaeota archaeon]|nr:hypothetical protein [Candidatus Calditenuis fumarioli]
MGLNYFVLDSERVRDDLSLSSLDELAKRADESSGPRVVITVPVRRSDFPERLEGTMRILSRRDRASICLVAGNPAYLTEEERSRSAPRLLSLAAGRVLRELGKRIDVFVGTERVEGTVERLCKELDVVPFLLLDLHPPELLERFRPNGNRLAVYVPFALGPLSEALPALLPYVKRRMMVRHLTGDPSDHVERFCVVGDPERVASRLRSLTERYDVIVGYPALLDPAQLRFWALVNHATGF